MPRTTKNAPAAATVESRPFADGSRRPYGRIPTAAQIAAGTFPAPTKAQAAVAKRIAADKTAGLSGDELRAKYGERLTGPARRLVLRSNGLDSPATIARSYVAYRNGEERKGTRHPREHGAGASAAMPTPDPTPAPRKRAPRKTRASK